MVFKKSKFFDVKGVKDVSIKGVKIGDVFRDVTTNNVIGEVTI